MKLRRQTFILSALLHVLALLWISGVKVPMLVYPEKERIIIIKPLSVPPLDFFPSSAARKVTPKPDRGKKEKQDGSRGGETLDSLPVSPVIPFPAAQTPAAELPEESRLTVPPPEEKAIPELSIYSEKMQDYLRDFERRKASARAGTGAGVGESAGGGTGGSATGQSRAFFDIRGYDLKPWARQALLRIQRNWSIPLTTKEQIQCPVEIVTVIEKSGRVSGVSVKVSSQSEVFDRSAMNAILLSSPLPSLPLDFPAKNLEVRFMFTSSELL